jgi:GDPmannose 4,6-dehydratase
VLAPHTLAQSRCTGPNVDLRLTPAMLTQMSAKTALITGIAGQDGIYLARFLRAKGYRVVGTCAPASASLARLGMYLGGVEVDRVDVRDGLAMQELIMQTRPDEIYNLAAMSSVGASWQHAEEVAEVNGMSVLRMLESLLRYRDKFDMAPRFYQASSSEIFGLAVQQPQGEGTPHHPRSPYGASKSFAHHLTVNYRESYGLFACNGILFNHESPLRATQFVTRKITRAVAEIHVGLREGFSLGNVDVRRDWGFAGDYVEAMWLMLQQPEADDYVIATGVSSSIRDFVEAAFACVNIADPWGRIREDPAMMRPADVPTTWGSPAHARVRLGWTPTTSFTALVEHMVATDLVRLRTGLEEAPALLSSPQHVAT